MPKILIAGTNWLPNPDRAWLARQWVRLAQEYDPGTDMLLVDCLSPEPLPSHPLLDIYQLGENVGHLAAGGRDGWGRACMKCLEIGVARGYDWIAFWDSDILWTKSAREVVANLGRFQVGSVRVPLYGWLESIFFFHTAWLRRSDFIARYDWEHSPVAPVPELRCETLIGDALVDLKLPGARDDHKQINRENIRLLFPNGCTWLTHANRDAYEGLLDWYGFPAPIEAQ